MNETRPDTQGPSPLPPLYRTRFRHSTVTPHINSPSALRPHGPVSVTPPSLTVLETSRRPGLVSEKVRTRPQTYNKVLTVLRELSPNSTFHNLSVKPISSNSTLSPARTLDPNPHLLCLNGKKIRPLLFRVTLGSSVFTPTIPSTVSGVDVGEVPVGPYRLFLHLLHLPPHWDLTPTLVRCDPEPRAPDRVRETNKKISCLEGSGTSTGVGAQPTHVSESALSLYRDDSPVCVTTQFFSYVHVPRLTTPDTTWTPDGLGCPSGRGLDPIRPVDLVVLRKPTLIVFCVETWPGFSSPHVIGYIDVSRPLSYL